VKIEKILGWILVVASSLTVSTLHSAEIAKYAGEFMSIGVGARALGMGGAYASVGGDATSGYWNPAGLTSINYPELAGMHSRNFGGVVNFDFVAFAIPFRKDESLAITMTRLAVDDIPITALPRPNLPMDSTYTDDQGNVLANRPYAEKWVTDGEYAFYLSYAKRHSDRLCYGANVKFVSKGVGDNSAWGIGFDIGALWNPIADLQTGINLQDATTTLLAWDTGRRELISPTVKAGLGYPFQLDFMRSNLLVVADTDVRFEGREMAAQAHVSRASFDFHFGGELLVRNVVALRAGSDTGHLTAGAGLRLPRLELDYAFLSHDDFEATHRVSLRVRIEEEKFARK
jgi:hypothetical protein